ncbi:MAG: hypothetical protein GTO22_26690 [Gemmatimonadales bacterium]|nr:hypothetical protein [Gemmatimonadales bacterium]
MDRRVITTGLLGGLVALGWTVVAQNLIPIRNDLGYKEVSNEETVLSALDPNLTETGLYLVPGHSPPDSLFRSRYEEGPIFRIHSLRSGAGGPAHVLIPMLALLIAPVIPTWILWRLCQQERPTLRARIAVVALFGIFLALSADLRMWGMELYPLSYSLFLGLSSVAGWVIVGLLIAWRIRPKPVAAGW